LLAAFEFRALGQRMHDALLLIASAIVARGTRVQALAPCRGLSLLTLLELREGDAEMAEAQEMPHLVRELPVAVVAAAEALAIDQDGASLAISRTLEARPVAAGVLQTPDQIDVEADEGLLCAVDRVRPSVEAIHGALDPVEPGAPGLWNVVLILGIRSEGVRYPVQAALHAHEGKAQPGMVRAPDLVELTARLEVTLDGLEGEGFPAIEDVVLGKSRCWRAWTTTGMLSRAGIPGALFSKSGPGSQARGDPLGSSPRAV